MSARVEHDTIDASVDLSNNAIVRYTDMESFTRAFGNYKTPDNVLGRGGYGNVYKANWIDRDNKPVVVKEFNPYDNPERLKSSMNDINMALDTLRVEVSIHSLIAHENIVQMHAYCHPRGRVESYQNAVAANVYAIASRGSLADMLKSNNNRTKYLPILDRLMIMHDIARALDYLHNLLPGCTIVHRDVKPDNILVEETNDRQHEKSSFRGLLADFGMAIIELSPGADPTILKRVYPLSLAEIARHDGSGTHGYIAPEIDQNFPPTPRSDVYAFGITLLHVFDIHPQNSNMVEFAKEIQNNPRIDRRRFEGAMNSINAIIQSCCHDNPFARPYMRLVMSLLEETIRHLSSSYGYYDHPIDDNEYDVFARKNRRRGLLNETNGSRDDSRREFENTWTMSPRKRQHIGAPTDKNGFLPAIRRAVLVPCEHTFSADNNILGICITHENKHTVTMCPYCTSKVDAVALA